MTPDDPNVRQPASAGTHSSPMVTVEHQHRGPGLFIRSVWFILVGWWLAGIVSVAAWLLAVTIIGLPLALVIFNRIPTVLTLRPRRSSVTSTVDEHGNVTIRQADFPQPAFWKRAVYFVLVGWWFSAVWIAAAWILCVLIVTLPLGVMMYNRLPAITTLHRY